MVVSMLVVASVSCCCELLVAGSCCSCCGVVSFTLVSTSKHNSAVCKLVMASSAYQNFISREVLEITKNTRFFGLECNAGRG